MVLLEKNPPVRSAAPGIMGAGVLVVEDEMLIALDVETLLESADYSIIGPFGTVSAAAPSALNGRLRAAVLDINIRNELVWPIADILQARGVPFLFLTGYAREVRIPARFANVIRLEKPFKKNCLMEAVLELISVA